MTEEANYEDGKPVEEYISELNTVEETLAIKPEPVPEATQRLETVVEEPVRNKNQKKTEAKKQEPPKPTATMPQSVDSKSIANASAATTNTPQLQVPTEPYTQLPPQSTEPALPSLPAPTPQAPLSQSPVPQPESKVVGVDEYIENMSQQAGQQKYIEVKSNAYRNINALFQGELVLVPTQQLQQLQQQQQTPPQPAPEPKQPPELIVEVPSLMQKVNQLGEAFKDSSLSPTMKRAIKKQQCELLGIPFDESMMAETSTLPAVSPVNPKLANDNKKEKPKKRPLKLKEKAMITGVGIAVIVLVIMTIGYLI